MPENKTPEPDDPFELKGHVAGGDPEVMARSIIEEYARMGWDREKLIWLFENPNFSMPHKFYQKYGEEKTKELIDEVLKKHGVLQFDVQQQEEEEK